jgi:hypothetical protein
MKLSLKTLLVVLLLCVGAVAANAMSNQVALVTIRFNQQVVAYQNQLYNAVVEAVKVKPSVIFTVVGYAPTHSDSDKAKKLLENTQYYASKVSQDLINIGVNPQQVRTNVETSQQIRDEEVRIFVN